MSKIKLTLPVFVLVLLSVFNQTRAQELRSDLRFPIDPIYYTVFDPDSLKGFDETAARAAAISEGFLGSEFRVKMYRLKREYIDNKYGIVRYKQYTSIDNYLMATRPAAAPGCTNEDFEASNPAVITASNQIAGWTVMGGYNGALSPTSSSTLAPYFPGGLSNPTSCNLIGCCPVPPSHSELIDCSAPGGYIDVTIGPQYPIYSVFGNGLNPAANAANPQVFSPMGGSKVLRLNDELTGDYSMERLSKTFSVTPQNALFQFAFISVFALGHSCCDAGGFQIKLSNATANTVIPCPQFSVSAPSSQCTATVPIKYFNVGTGTPANPNAGSGNVYHPWKINSMDLTAYIGQSITIDIIISDCNAGGHFGCIYFDAQCGPMKILGNGTAYDAGSNPTVPTCGAAGATMCAVDGLGPYSWAGPNVPPNYTIPSFTNQCFITNVSATYTLYMQPEGSCVPISRVITSTITPAPLLNASVLQATCGSTLAVVSLTPSGSAANPSSLNWSPTPQTLGTGSVTASYGIPSGNTPATVSVTASDPLGCLITTTVNINPAPPIPTFAIVNTTNSNSITCYNPTVNLNINTNYSYNGGSLNYLWSSASTTFNANSASIIYPGTYTVTGTDPVTQCSTVQIVSIGINTLSPNSIMGPSFQNITCTVAPANVTVTATQTANITHMIMAPQGGTFATTSFSATYPPGGVGTFTYCLRDDINGCTTCKEFTVASSQVFPNFDITSSFTLGCNATSCTPISIDHANSGGAPVSYTLLPPGTSSVLPTGTLSGNNVYNVCVPGSYTVITRDNNTGCETRVPISMLQNTWTPNISAVVPRIVLDCNNPKMKMQGISTTPGVEFLWMFQGTPNSIQGDSILVEIKDSQPTQTVVNNYTLVITELNNTCKSTSVIPIYQNLFPPKAIISPVTSSISCKTPSIVLTNQSETGIPASTGYPTNLPRIGFLWTGPTPQDPRSNATTYEAYTPGTYTMVAKDLNNGCVASTTVNVVDFRIAPVVNDPPAAPVVLDCGASKVTLSPVIVNPATGNVTNLTYTWSTPPASTIGDIHVKDLAVNVTGEYQIIVTNTLNGCASASNMDVVNGKLSASFDPDVITGFAPLTVNFNNTSSSSLGNASINSVWNFGNQTSQTFSTVQSATAVYNQAGSYTVTLFATKGSCMESFQRVIKVEMPSAMEIPNVFTPNGDGANDLFFIRANNLVEITAVIFDRWGHKVYEVTSTTGNIEWDGKNAQGKDAAEGTYFYVIKGTGKDDKAYDKKGTISLYR